MFNYIDAHNHLQDKALLPSLPAILPVCQKLGVTRMIVNGITEGDWDAISELAKQCAFVTASYGLHPWYLKTRRMGWEERLEQRLVADPKAHVGETGLDCWMPEPDLAVQIETLRHSLQITSRRQRAITIHCLRAWDVLLDVLCSETLPVRGFLLHAYSGPIELIEPFTELGAYFSFSGYFLNPGKEHRLEPFEKISEDRILAETDAPSMPLPEDRREFRLPGRKDGETVNHPGNISVVYRALAGLRKVSLDGLVKTCAQNCSRLFGEG